MRKAHGNLLGLLGSLTHYKVTTWATDSDGFENWEDGREPADISTGANVSSSLIAGTDNGWRRQKHALLLDLDVPAYLVPSSTPGHSHLYVDVEIEQEDYWALLDALAKCGVIEKGYAQASKKKGGTFLRLPWVKKGDQTK